MTCLIRSFPARRPLALLTLGMCLGAHALAAAPQPKLDRAAHAGRVLHAPGGAALDHDGFIVYYRDDADPQDAASPRARQVADQLDADLARIAHELGIRAQAQRRTATGGHVVVQEGGALDAEAANRFMARLADNPEVVSVEPNLRMYPAALPNDPLLGYQWGLYEAAGGINAEPAWDQANGSGIVIAVIDTGQTAHPDLDAKTRPGIDLISDPANSRDGNGRDANPADEGDWNAAGQCGQDAPQRASTWHGTHVAGIAAALTNNGEGVAGVAYLSWLQHVRVLGTCGGTLADIADGMVWASGGQVPGVPANPTPARVLNLSLGGISACGTTYQAAINSARSRGSVLIVAAGNDTVPAAMETPANCQGVVTVASNGRTGGRAVYSNYGIAVDVSAPGGDSSNSANDGILSTINLGTTVPIGPGYDMKDGTSMAAPYVAGIAALMLSRNAALTPDQIEALLRNTARPFPSFCSGGCGTGIVDAGAAVAAAAGGSISAFPLSVALLGNGQGRVLSAPTRINCGTTGSACSARFNANTSVALTATATAGYVFGGWGGACSGTAATCTLTMNRGQDAYAVFSVPIPTLANGATVANLASPDGAPRYFQMQVPAGASNLKFQIAGGSGDADLYARRGNVPDATTFDCRPYLAGNNETCTFPAPAAGTWYVMLVGDPGYAGVSLQASYSQAQGGAGIFCNGMEAQSQACPP